MDAPLSICANPTSPRVPSLRTIPANRWALKVPPVSDFHSSRPRAELERPDTEMDYERACREMEALGFEKVFGHSSLRHSQLKYLRSGEAAAPAEEYALWHHPAGVLVVADSYYQAGHRDWRDDSRWVEPELKMGSMSMYAQIDTGTGPELKHRSAVAIRGSGSSEPMLDGTDRKIVHVTPRGGDSFLGFLRTCQAHGRFVPVGEWTRDAFFYLPPEFLLPIRDASAWRGRDIEEEVKKNPALTLPGKQVLEEQLPSEIFGVVSQSWEDIEARIRAKQEGTDLPQKPRPDWMRVEEAHRIVSEVLFMAGKRFPVPAERSLIQHWMEVALGRHGNNPADWRAFEAGPGGLSLATILLFSNREQEAQDRLIELVRQAPPDVLAQWLEKPDAAGYVLGQLLLWRCFCGSMTEDTHKLQENIKEVLAAIVGRVGPKAVRLETPGRSALGLWMQTPESDEVGPSGAKDLCKRQCAASHVLGWMDSLGLDWFGPVRWRTYPNTVMTRHRPRFMCLDAPQAQIPALWPNVLAKRLFPDSNKEVLRLLRSRQMDQRLPPAPRTRPAHRF